VTQVADAGAEWQMLIFLQSIKPLINELVQLEAQLRKLAHPPETLVSG
jgi:hypothetical protein